MSIRISVPGLVLMALLAAGICSAPAQQSAAVDPTALVRRAIQHRFDSEQNQSPVRYLLRKQDGPRDNTKDIIETRDGDVARLVALNGQPLSAQATQDEVDRLNLLANHPEVQQHRKFREQKDADRVNRLMRLLPDAFLYRFEGMVPCVSGQCYRLSFSPNPRFTPPDVEAAIFRGMAGEVWIDQTQERLTRLNAHLISNVDFGWGILGKLDEGGTIQIEQADIGDRNWQVTLMKLNLRGKALMFKSLNIKITEQASHFSPVPAGIDYRQAIQLLRKSDGPIVP